MNMLLMNNYLVSFYLYLYGESTLSRDIVDKVVNFVRQFLITIFLPSLKKDIYDILKKDSRISEEVYVLLNSVFDDHVLVFDSISSEAKRFKSLKNMYKLKINKTDKVDIGECFHKVMKDGKEKLIEVPLSGAWIPLRDSLKLFLQIPNMLKNIKSYIEKLEKETDFVTNIITNTDIVTNLWKKFYKPLFKNDFVLPIYVYYDDIEVGNPLGSHAGKNKFGLVYTSIACLPPEIASQLDSILFTTIFHVDDYKNSNNQNLSCEISARHAYWRQ
ncbi:hypothetical protein TKK_0009536 [Trichogramma kaykai]